MVAGPHCIIMPLRGPTCKIARFQAVLKFPSWTECGKKDPGTHSAALFYRCNITNIVVYNVRKLLLRIYCIPLHLSNQGCILHCIYVGN